VWQLEACGQSPRSIASNHDRGSRRNRSWPGELAEWNTFNAANAFAALAGGADRLFARQLEAAGMMFARLADKSDPLRCVVCRTGLAPDVMSIPALIGWLKPILRDDLYVFALCYACATDDSEDFPERFLTAIAGKGARDIPAGRA
jgi:hypothetical protein